MTNTLFVGKVYYRFDKLPSTNDYALELIAKSRPPEGTVVQAAMQTAGRGQYGSRWESAAGENLTLSVIFYPTWLEPRRQFGLSMAVALAVRATVEGLLGSQKARLDVATNPKVTIKWPNDIYLDDKKTAGILIQNSLSANRLAASVVGIGLNVNQQAFPPELPNATSLAVASSATFDLEFLAATLFEALEQQYLALRAGGAAQKEAYLQHLYRFGVPELFRRTVDETVFEGVIRGVSEEGKLVVDGDRGTEEFDIKELIYI